MGLGVSTDNTVQLSLAKLAELANNIYNSSFFGSVLWDLFSPEAEKIESSWNRSMKIMMDLPYDTHRGLIEPLSGCNHIKRIFIKVLHKANSTNILINHTSRHNFYNGKEPTRHNVAVRKLQY